MKKLLLFLTVALVAFSSCDKNNRADEGEKVGEVQFTSETLDIEKSFEKDGNWDCESEVHYVLMYIDGDMRRMPVFYFEGMLTTQSIKLSVGTHTLEEFILMNNNGTPDDYSDDAAIQATVHTGAAYAEFVDFLVNYDFTVQAFTKSEVHVEVLCIEESSYDDFGFTFFSVWETVIRQKYFFGDICVLCLDDYQESAYANQSGGVLLDNAAIFEIRAYRNGEYVNTIGNMDVYGEGVVCVPYADRIGIEDLFEFELWVYAAVGDGYDYVYQHTYSFYDDAALMENAENVNTFVLGDCLYGTEGVLVLPQYINLPETVDFTLAAQAAPSQSGNYFDITFSNIVGTYAIENTTYGGYCAQDNVFVTLGTTYTADVFSSLDIAKAAAETYLTEAQILKLHVLANILEASGYDIENMGSGQWNVVQSVVWSITNGLTLSTQSHLDLRAAADAAYANWANVPNQNENVVVILDAGDEVQLQIMKVGVCE